MIALLTTCGITNNTQQKYFIYEESFLTYCQFIQLDDNKLHHISSCCLKRDPPFVLSSTKLKNIRAFYLLLQDHSFCFEFEKIAHADFTADVLVKCIDLL